MLITHIPHFYKNIFNMDITRDSVHISGRSADGHEFEPMQDSPPRPKGFFFFFLILKKQKGNKLAMTFAASLLSSFLHYHFQQLCNSLNT